MRKIVTRETVTRTTVSGRTFGISNQIPVSLICEQERDKSLAQEPALREGLRPLFAQRPLFFYGAFVLLKSGALLLTLRASWNTLAVCVPVRVGVVTSNLQLVSNRSHIFHTLRDLFRTRSLRRTGNRAGERDHTLIYVNIDR